MPAHHALDHAAFITMAQIKKLSKVQPKVLYIYLHNIITDD